MDPDKSRSAASPRHEFGSLRYPDYLEVSQLLSLQKPLTEHPDEYLFIVAHQIFELGFSLVIRELDALRERLPADPRHALKAAERCHELSKGENWQFLDTLALARFESGQKEEAAEIQRKAISLGEEAGAAAQQLDELKERLKQFER